MTPEEARITQNPHPVYRYFNICLNYFKEQIPHKYNLRQLDKALSVDVI